MAFVYRVMEPESLSNSVSNSGAPKPKPNPDAGRRDAHGRRFTWDTVAFALLEKAKEKAAQDARLTVEEMMKLPNGSMKRRIHDDITIVVIKL